MKIRRTILCLLALCLVFSLTGCGSGRPSDVIPDIPAVTHASGETATPQETAAVQETAAQAPEATPVPSADPESVFYFANRLETGRIYRQGLDGSGLTLICDVEAEKVAEMGDTLCFTTRGEELCRCPAAGGPAETVFSEHDVYGILKVTDTVLLFWCSTDRDPWLYSYDTVSGQITRITDRLFGSDVFATEGMAVYPVSDPATYSMDYFRFDPATGESVPCPKGEGQLRTVFAFGGGVYQHDAETDAWYRYDIRTLERAPVDYDGDEMDQILGWDGKDLLLNNGSNAYQIIRLSDSGRTPVYLFPSEDHDEISPVACKGGTAILCTVKYGETPVFENTETWMTERIRYYALSVSEGTVKEITEKGEAGRMFADGSFPKLDVSTARKPLVQALCALFFRNYGTPGAEPVNHKSHGAWLDLADKGCDLILVPAPTEEETSYLKEKGVEAEIKVFGADGLVFICGTGAGVTNLSMEQLKSIYRGEIRNWKELGGADHAITVFYRNDQSGSQRQFEKLVWQEKDIPDFGSLGFKIMTDMETIVMECQADPYAIGYSIMTYLTDVFSNENVVLMGIDGTAPTVQTVTDGSYPLTLQDVVAIRSDEAADSPARRLYEWFGTPQSDDVLRQHGLTPVH